MTNNAQPSGQQPAAGRRRKRPRVIAAPQHLEAKVQLTGSYEPLEQVDSVLRAQQNERAAGTEAQEKASASKDPLAGLRAKDDNPALWGEANEDLAESMKREKPPHWG